MYVICLASLNGGVGRTTLVAQLASLLAKRGQPILALDADPQNQLAAHLGLTAANTDTPGWSWQAAGAPDRDWSAIGQRNSDGVTFIPFGTLNSAQRNALDNHLRTDTDYLSRQLGVLDLTSETIVLIDAARMPSATAEQAIHVANLVLWVVVADPSCLFSWKRNSKQANAEARRGYLLINRFDATRPLQADMLELFQSTQTTIPYLVHRDEAMPASFAADLCLADYAPDCQAIHDLHGVAYWLQQQATLHRAAHTHPTSSTA